MVKSHIFAMLWLLFIRCRQLENVIGFLSQIIIYIFRGCQILFWNKLNQNDISVRSLYINLFFLIKINFLWLKKKPFKDHVVSKHIPKMVLWWHIVLSWSSKCYDYRIKDNLNNLVVHIFFQKMLSTIIIYIKIILLFQVLRRFSIYFYVKSRYLIGATSDPRWLWFEKSLNLHYLRIL